MKSNDHLIHFGDLQQTRRSETVEHWKKLYLEFAPQTTIHGVKEFTANDHINMKILWAFLITGCMIGMGIGTYQIISQYYQSPTTSSVEHITPNPFPLIKFCPKNWINCTRASFYYNMDPDELQLLKWLSWYNFDYYQMSEYGKNVSIAEARTKLNQSLTQVYQFKQLSQIYNQIALTTEDIIEAIEDTKAKVAPVNIAKGVCYTINFIANDLKPGDFMQYFMMVNKVQYYLNDKWSCVSNSTIDHPELRGDEYDTIAIGGDAISDYSENNYAIMPGQSLSFKIRTTKHHFPKSHSINNCMNQPDYVQLNCLNNCTAALVHKTFNCYFYFGENALLPPNVTTDGLQTTDWSSYCLLNPNISTIDDILKRGIVNYSDSEYVQCQKLCKIPCDQSTYEPIILSLSSDGKKSVKTKFEFEFRNYFSSIEISETSAYQWPSMMGNIGGMISLWTGCSFISLCHIVYHFFLRQICPKPKTINRLRHSMSDNMLSRRSSLSSLRSLKLKNGDSITKNSKVKNLSHYYTESVQNDTSDAESYYSRSFGDVPSSPGRNIDIEAGQNTHKLHQSDTLRERVMGTLRRLRKTGQDSDGESSAPEIAIQIGHVGRRKTVSIEPPRENSASGIPNLAFENESEDNNNSSEKTNEDTPCRRNHVAKNRKMSSESKQSRQSIRKMSKQSTVSPNSTTSSPKTEHNSKKSTETTASSQTVDQLKCNNDTATTEESESIAKEEQTHRSTDNLSTKDSDSDKTNKPEPKIGESVSPVPPVTFGLNSSDDSDSETYGLPAMIMDPIELLERNRQNSNELAARRSSSSSSSVKSESQQRPPMTAVNSRKRISKRRSTDTRRSNTSRGSNTIGNHPATSNVQ